MLIALVYPISVVLIDRHPKREVGWAALQRTSKFLAAAPPPQSPVVFGIKKINLFDSSEMLLGGAPRSVECDSVVGFAVSSAVFTLFVSSRPTLIRSVSHDFRPNFNLIPLFTVIS